MSLSQAQIKSIQDSMAMLAENNLETDKLDNDGEPMTEAQALSIAQSTVWLAINGTGISGAIADGYLSDDLAGATIGDVETVISANSRAVFTQWWRNQIDTVTAAVHGYADNAIRDQQTDEWSKALLIGVDAVLGVCDDFYTTDQAIEQGYFVEWTSQGLTLAQIAAITLDLVTNEEDRDLIINALHSMAEALEDKPLRGFINHDFDEFAEQLFAALEGADDPAMLRQGWHISLNRPRRERLAGLPIHVYLTLLPEATHQETATEIPTLVCPICRSDDVTCLAVVDANTGEIHDYRHEVGDCQSCGAVLDGKHRLVLRGES